MALAQGHHTASINGLELAYTVVGEGPPLFITSPGWGVGSTYLQRGMRALCQEFTCIFVDTRGSGRSGQPPTQGDMGSAAMAEDIDQLRRHLGLGSIDLMGHSNGGAIGIAFAATHAAACRKLILVDSQLIGFGGSDATQEFLSKAMSDPRYESAVKFAGLPLPESDEAFTQRVHDLLPLFFNDPAKNLPLFRDTMEGLVAASASHAQTAADRMPGADQTGRLGDIKAKTLILVGRHDWICPLPVSERLHAGIASSTLEVFDNTGHVPWIEEPEHFLITVTRFLNSP
jgi:proline iminopeptidase